MAWSSPGRPGAQGRGAPRGLLRISGLDVYYGRAHALQSVSLALGKPTSISL